ncbi:MAG: signal peptide peptidase SppA [Candidatus Krumholzibacteriia bacterium]
MKGFIKSFFASLLAIVFLFVVIIGAAALKGREKPKVKDGSYLVVDIYGEILPYNPPDDLVAEVFGGEPETLQRILGNLEKAALDDRIKGVIMKVSSSNTLGYASMEEIRHRIHAVRDAGKKVFAYADNLDRKGLFLASACDSIFMPPTSELFFAGFGLTRSYVRGTLDKLGIEPNIHKIDEYKSAAELVLRKDMSPEAREMINWIYDDFWDVQMQALSDERGIPRERLVELMDYALFIAHEARDAGLIDKVMYWDEIETALMDEDDDKLRTVSQGTYAKVERKSLGLHGKKKIAVVHAHGTIGGRESHVDPMLGIMMGHASMARELRRVRADDDVAAVVFRVASPGGESLASDLISREIERLAEEKPVVVSMVDVAASGGYSISYRATKIVADPLTITGSIGSISGKFNMSGLYNKLGVTFDFVGRGPNGFLWNPYRNFTPAQRERFEENHWQGFNIWLEDIAEERGIRLEALQKLAMGRVWTGRQALDNGLIDELGGLDRAIELARELAELPADEGVTVVDYPKKKGILEMISSGGGPHAAMRWVLYRFIRHDLAQSLEILSRVSAVPVP